MARTHHRKCHKQALSDRRFHQRIQASIKRAEDAAANRCYQITPDLDDHLRFDGDAKAGTVTATVDGRSVTVASVDEGTVTLGEAPPKKSSVCVTADYRQLEQRVIASMSQQAYDLWKDRCRRHIQVLSDPEIKGPTRSAYKMRALRDLYGGSICDPMTSKDLEGAWELIRKYWESYPRNSGLRIESTPHVKPSMNFLAQALAAGRLDASGNIFSQEALEKAFGPGFTILPDGSLAITQQVRSDDPTILDLNPEDPSQHRYLSMGCDAGFRPGVKTDLHGAQAPASSVDFREGPGAPPEVPPAFPHPILLSGLSTCSVCGAVWPCQIHSGTHHVELGWHKDPETGEPVFDEVSLCAGPDPNGLTTILPGNGGYRSYKEWMSLSPEEYAAASGGIGISYPEWLALAPEERDLPYWRPAGQSMFDREAQP